MIDQHHQHIGAGQRRIEGRQRTQSIEFLRQRVNVGLNHLRRAAVPAGNLRGNFHRRAFAQVVNIRFKSEAKTGDRQFAGPFVGGIQAVRDLRFHLFDNPFRLMVVDLASGADQTRLLRVLRHDKPRVDGDAVAADARARLQDIDARMAVCRADQLPDVNAPGRRKSATVRWQRRC